MLLIATRVIRKVDRAGRAAFDSLTLDSEARQRRRARFITDGGRAVMLDLDAVSHLADGDALEVEGQGGLIEIKAAAEPLLEIRAEDALSLARVAWHLGNRHTPAQVTADALFIQPDHVLEAMVGGLGAEVRHVNRAFEPERGAYSGHSHGHGAGHHHGHHADDGGHSHEHSGGQGHHHHSHEL
jgi:urease accessory protein